jgi:hypothetical protein
MSIFQLGAVIFALVMLYVISIHDKKKIFSSIEASFWYSLWSFFIIISLFPDLLLGITGVLRFARVFDFLVVASFMITTVLLFYSYFQIKNIKNQLEKIVRDRAIKDAQKK